MIRWLKMRQGEKNVEGELGAMKIYSTSMWNIA